MKATVISDVHIGSSHLQRDLFLRFLAQLPEGSTLVLNGDTLDHRRRRLAPPDQAVLERLGEESFRRPVIWVFGNHDEGCVLRVPHRFQFAEHWNVEQRLYVAHGNRFGPPLPGHHALFGCLHLLHVIRVRLGGESIHVAQYAKKWSRGYKALCDLVVRRAVRFARARGYAAVACGHTHGPEEREMEGVRYFNTGSWTEPAPYYLEVNDERITLRPVAGADLPPPTSPT